MELAIQKDCETIIESFVSNENPRFESFVYQWMATTFQRIYTAQTLSSEIIQSTNACIHYAKRILSSKNIMPRLGALFLVYAIHFKQPTDRFHKIDLDLASWIKLKEFIASLDNKLNTEGAKCIFWELVKENSFRFVASEMYYGLEKLVNLDGIRNNAFNLDNTLYIFRADVSSLTSRRGLCSGINKLEDGYNEMKELMNQSGSERHRTIPVSRMFNDLKSAIDSLSAFINKSCPQRQKLARKVKRSCKKKHKSNKKETKGGIRRRKSLR